MTFNTPNVDTILETLVCNNALINSLRENGALITKEKLLEEYHISVMKQAVIDANFKNVQAMQDLALLILENEEHIRKESIWQLTAEEFLFKEIREIFGISKAKDNLYQSIFYCYKYCYVSSFFQNNADKFVPQCDIDEIKNNPAADAFLDAMLKEFDKISRLLDETKDYLDYDKIPWDYIVYLTQLLGLEKDYLNIDDTEEAYYRELAKNILDIYRVKGTNYSFQLFFNFLGIEIEIHEFFFDRRYYYSKYPQQNEETGTSDKFSKDFYLTTINPSYNLNPNFSTSEIINLSDFSEQQNLKDFEELVSEYGLEAVLGYSDYDKNGEKYEGKVYKYFKTNYIYYYASSLGNRANLTGKQINSLSKYLDFLTPIFVMRDIKTIAYSISGDSDFIAFNGGGDRKYGALIDGTFEGFQMLDSECWDTVNKDLYTTINDNNEIVYYSKNGQEIKYKNSLPTWNDVDTLTFRQPLDFGYISIFTSRYLGPEKQINDSTNRIQKSCPRRVKFYSYDDGSGRVYKYSTPRRVSLDVSKTDVSTEKINGYSKINSTKGKDDPSTVRNRIEENEYYKEIKYVIDSEGKDVNLLLDGKLSLENSNNISKFEELNKCSWKEYLLPYDIKMLKTTMYSQEVNGTTIGNAGIIYPAELETSAEKILNSFNIVLFTGQKITNPRNEAERYLNSIYVDIGKIRKYLTVGDCFVKLESGKFNVYRCQYANKKVWWLSKLFPDVIDSNNIPHRDSNNNIQLSGNYRNERNFTNALKNFYTICQRGNVDIDRYSHLYKVGGSSGYYYAPTQVYTEIYNEDISKPSGLVRHSDRTKGWYIGKKDDVGKTFFEGINITYSNGNLLENAADNNMRYICFWDRQIGDLIYDEYDGKIYCVCNYGPKGLVEIKFNGTVKKVGNNYRLYEYDEFWKGYDEEADSDDFIAYNNEHIINWNELGIYGYKWHRPTKPFTDRLYDNLDNFKNQFNEKLFEIISDTKGEKSFKKMLLRDIWNRTYESFSEDLKNSFIANLPDIPEDDPNTQIIEYYTSEELFSVFYKMFDENKYDTVGDLIQLLEDSVLKEHYELSSKESILEIASLFQNEWSGFDQYYNYTLQRFENLGNNINDFVIEDDNRVLHARGRYNYNEHKVMDDFDEYSSSTFLMLDLLKNFHGNNGTNNSDEFLKEYFYEELLKRYREAFVSDDNGTNIDSVDFGIFRALPSTVEKLNGKGGKFAAPKMLNSQFINEGGDNYTSTKIPLKSIEFIRNTDPGKKIYIKIGNQTIQKDSTDIIFKFGLKEWYVSSREIFGINTVNDFKGGWLKYGDVNLAIDELRENYLKSFSPTISIPRDALNDNGTISKTLSDMVVFKTEIEKDYSNEYEYHAYYVNNNVKTEIKSIEDGVVKIYYNGSWADYNEDTNTSEKLNKLRDIFNKSIIEIKINNSSKNPYLTKKRFKDVDFGNIYALSDCQIIGSGRFELKRENPQLDGNVGYITLKYLRHKFKDNVISVPNSIDWVKIKNGIKDEYTSYLDDREVASKTVNTFYKDGDEYDEEKISSKIELLKNGGVINLETGEIVKNPTVIESNITADAPAGAQRKTYRIITSIKDGATDITSKAKKINANLSEFAERLIDKSGDIILKLKNISLSDVKQIALAFNLSFVKVASSVIRVSSYFKFRICIRKQLNDLLLNVLNLNNIHSIGILLRVLQDSIDIESNLDNIYRKGIYEESDLNDIDTSFNYRMICINKKPRLLRISVKNAVKYLKLLIGLRFIASLINVISNTSSRIRIGHKFSSLLDAIGISFTAVHRIGHKFGSLLDAIEARLSDAYGKIGKKIRINNITLVNSNLFSISDEEQVPVGVYKICYGLDALYCIDTIIVNGSSSEAKVYYIAKASNNFEIATGIVPNGFEYYIIVTEEEWTALSEEEKNSGMYIKKVEPEPEPNP